MESGQRISGWSRASLWYGIVFLAFSVAALIADQIYNPRWWEQTDLTKAREALEVGTSRSVALIAVSTVAGLLGAALCLAAVGQCWRSLGTVIGLGRAWIGFALTGLGASAMLYVAIRQQSAPNPWLFIAFPTVATIWASWNAWRGTRHMSSTIAALTVPDPKEVAVQANPSGNPAS
jgi:hypothetical protein